MFKKINLSIKGWLFAAIIFLLAVYFGFINFHYAGIKNIEINFLFTNFGLYFKELVMAMFFLVIYLLFSLIPSKKFMMIPNLFLLMSAGQSLVQFYYTLPRLNILGSIAEFIIVLSLLGMAYSFSNVSFEVIDDVGNIKGQNLFERWTNQVNKSLTNHWKITATFILIYVIFVSITTITIVFK
ncbi:hypothetical protein DY037_00090 [Apilactobacillus micheneri]|uniref:Uncharacterized protein n=1 Tax=Apilactobacillus micheneri TaxID=1899430 RepID=A0A9Q8IND7_9LACO|nr:hypothetical protein [Apilactobacillus micheneri]TPR39827.1 hypothetical protein DY121_04775 [Apilactobacillus micheneri]TPR41467.1 hypothetical protein DY123_06220 [Apilactobacillus micheneri]TPR43748.1 hypothetical protein DY130_04770 [Apilactobacillus micheneri]TPR45301.1 hypothetical protein DY128_04770 [Apilactobacillus micheneri]TPR50387.1 hypothetical protein DY037_00090 [Apilactobacillus micheneri]